MILTWEQQQQLKPLSDSGESKFEQICKEVEDSDIVELLGLPFAQFVDENQEDVNVLKLIEPTLYTTSCGYDVKHKGLRYVIAYLVFSRYVYESSINDSYTGMVRKNREESISLSEGEVRRLSEQAKKQALTAFDSIKDFLNSNYTNYQLWDYADSSKKYFTPKFKKLRRYE